MGAWDTVNMDHLLTPVIAAKMSFFTSTSFRFRIRGGVTASRPQTLRGVYPERRRRAQSDPEEVYSWALVLVATSMNESELPIGYHPVNDTANVGC